MPLATGSYGFLGVFRNGNAAVRTRGSSDHRDNFGIRRRLGLTNGGQRAADGDERGSGDEQFLRREAGDHFMPGLGDDDLFLDARRAPSIRRRPEGLEREYHARLD